MYRQAKTQYISAHPVEAPHSVGVGDSFASVLTKHGEIGEAARIGVEAAGFAVTKPRVAVVSY